MVDIMEDIPDILIYSVNGALNGRIIYKWLMLLGIFHSQR